MPTDMYDCLIVGGGVAGHTVAVSIARNRHKTVCFNSNEFRNSRVDHFHMLPTWDNKDPVDFRAAARKNTLENYDTTEFVDTKITKTVKNDDGTFTAEDDSGRSWTGRTLVLASGVEDVMVDIPGYAECWVHSIYHCLFCHGYEHRDQASAGVLAIDDVAKLPFALHVSRNAAQLVKEVTIYTNDNPTFAKQIREEGLSGSINAPISVDDRKIVRLTPEPTKEGGLTVQFADGTSKKEAFLAHKPMTKIRGPFADQLGLARMPDGDIKVSPPFSETSVRGCFAAGDNSSFLKTVPNALNTGANVAAGAASHAQAAMYGQKSLSVMIAEMQAQAAAVAARP